MEKITRTLEQLTEIDQVIGRLYAKTPALRDTKFGYAWTKFFNKNIQPTLDKMKQEMNNIQITNALEDKTNKEILNDPNTSRGFKYSKEGLKECVKQEQDCINRYKATEIEVEPYISSFVPELNDDQKELMQGLVI